MHRRLRPRMHHFRYRAFWFLLDLDELDELSSTAAMVLTQPAKSVQFL